MRDAHDTAWIRLAKQTGLVQLKSSLRDSGVARRAQRLERCLHTGVDQPTITNLQEEQRS